MNNSLHPDQAIRDLELIRSILIQSEQTSELREIGSSKARQTQVMIHSGTLAVVAGFILIELLSDHVNTRFLLASTVSEAVLRLGISNLLIMLLVGLAAFYYAAFKAAESSATNLADYLKHHFTYLRNFSFAADLLVKYVVVSLLLFAKRPEWIAPILTLFIADYLFQRRFFVLPVRIGLVLGVFCLLLASVQFYYGSPKLIWSLLCFFVVGLVSLFHVLTNKKLAGF